MTTLWVTRKTSWQQEMLTQNLVAGASQHVFEEDCRLNHPHPLDEDIRWDSGWFWVGFGVVLGVTRDVPR